MNIFNLMTLEPNNKGMYFPFNDFFEFLVLTLGYNNLTSNLKCDLILISLINYDAKQMPHFVVEYKWLKIMDVV